MLPSDDNRENTVMDKLVCSIDIGSNSVRSAFCRDSGAGGVELLEFRRVSTRLLAGLCPHSGELPAAATAALAALVADIADKARARGCNDCRAVGTHVLRVAVNAEDIVAAVRERSGVEIEVLSCGREGYLAWLGGRYCCPGAREDIPVIDVGGGSLEIIRPLPGRTLANVISMPYGAVNSGTRFADVSEPVPDAELDGVLAGMERDFSRRLDLAGEAALKAVEVIGVGGSAFTLRRMLAAIGRAVDGDCPSVGPAELEEVLRALCALSAHERCARFAIEKDRADIIVAGLCVWAALCRLLGIKEIGISTQGLCLGLAIEHLGRA